MSELREKALGYIVRSYEEWPQSSDLGHHAAVSHCGYSWEQKGKDLPWELINDKKDRITEADYDNWAKYLETLSCLKGLSYSYEHVMRYVKKTNREIKMVGSQRRHGEGLLLLTCAKEPIMSFVVEILDESGTRTYVRAI